jgi:hypothetical protein
MRVNGFASIESLEKQLERLTKLLETYKSTGKTTPKIQKGKKRGGGKIMQGYKAGGKV